MEKKKIKLSSDQLRSLVVDGRCSVVGSVYEVYGIEGLYARFDESGELVKADAPINRPVGRPKKARIKSSDVRGLFVDKAGVFVVGQVVDVDSVYERRVEILDVKVKQAEDISDNEWKDMGYVWGADIAAPRIKDIALLSNGLTMKDKVGLYWYKEV